MTEKDHITVAKERVPLEPLVREFRRCYTCAHWPGALTGDHRRLEHCMAGWGQTHGMASCREWSARDN